MLITLRSHSRRRRGVAMLLVMVSLGMATILSIAYLASRDNSSAIGLNVSSSAAARWGADTGIEMGLAIMQTEEDWRTAHINGKLLDDYPLAEGSLDIDILDLETNSPPTDESDLIELTSTATINGVEQRIRSIASIGNSTLVPPPLDLDLSEFVVFGRDEITLGGKTTIALWETAPANAYGGGVALGTRATAMGKVSLALESAAIDATLFHLQSASSSLVVNNNPNAPSVRKKAIEDAIPIPIPPDTPGAPGNWQGDADIKSTTTLNTSATYGSLKLDGGRVTLQGDLIVYALDEIELTDGSGIIVDGNAKLVTPKDFRARGGSFIELMPGSTLEIFAGDEFELEDAYIGDLRADRSIRDNSGAASYMPPANIKIYGVDSSLRPDWRLRANTVVKGSLYAPFSKVHIDENSAIYGRLATNGLVMHDNAAIFYDRALDSGRGFTNPDSGAYDDNGRIKGAVRTVSSLNTLTLTLLSTLLGIPVEREGVVVGSYNLWLLGIIPPLNIPGQATPRPIQVDHSITAVGADVDAMELHAKQVAEATIDEAPREILGAAEGGDDEDAEEQG